MVADSTICMYVQCAWAYTEKAICEYELFNASQKLRKRIYRNASPQQLSFDAKMTDFHASHRNLVSAKC